MTESSKTLKTLSAPDRIKVLSDQKRLEIFQLLMVKPRTVSQLGRILDEYPAGVRYHIKKLEKVGLVELNEIRESPGYSEKYYSAKAGAIQLQGFILPKSEQRQIIFMGSHDLAFEKLSSRFNDQRSDTSILNFPIGSVDGLIALRQGSAHISGCHLYDPESDQYNSPFIKHFFPDQDIKTVTLAHRMQGIMISAGNPKGISSLEDLARDDIKFINRNRGSGTRIWLEQCLDGMGLNPGEDIGYTHEMNSHTGISHAIKSGEADMGIGLIAAAFEEGLDFIPLFEEQYDLVLTHGQFEAEDTQLLLELLNSGGYRKSISNLSGYNTQKTGNLMEVKIYQDASSQSYLQAK
jgi:putative molybdopterin biosynthesis protein